MNKIINRVLDMNAHLIRRAYQRAYLMKQFEREDLDDIKNLFKNFSTKFWILDLKEAGKLSRSIVVKSILGSLRSSIHKLRIQVII